MDTRRQAAKRKSDNEHTPQNSTYPSAELEELFSRFTRNRNKVAKRTKQSSQENPARSANKRLKKEAKAQCGGVAMAAKADEPGAPAVQDDEEEEEYEVQAIMEERDNQVRSSA